MMNNSCTQCKCIVNVTHARTYTQTCKTPFRKFGHIYTYSSTRMDGCIHTRTHIHTHTNTHTYTQRHTRMLFTYNLGVIINIMYYTCTYVKPRIKKVKNVEHPCLLGLLNTTHWNTYSIWGGYIDSLIHYSGCQVCCKLLAAMIVKQLQHLWIILQLQYTQCVIINVHRNLEQFHQFLATVAATVNTVREMNFQL